MFNWLSIYFSIPTTDPAQRLRPIEPTGDYTLSAPVSDEGNNRPLESLPVPIPRPYQKPAGGAYHRRASHPTSQKKRWRGVPLSWSPRPSGQRGQGNGSPLWLIRVCPSALPSPGPFAGSGCRWHRILVSSDLSHFAPISAGLLRVLPRKIGLPHMFAPPAICHVSPSVSPPTRWFLQIYSRPDNEAGPHGRWFCL